MKQCKHWFIENYKIGPRNERWQHCPYCGENRQIGETKKIEKRRKG